MDKRIGLNTTSLLQTHGELGAIDVIKNAGASFVDFYTNGYSMDDPKSVYSKSDDEIVEHFTKIKRYAEDRGLSIYQTHGRMRTYLNDPILNTLAIENARRDLLAAKASPDEYKNLRVRVTGFSDYFVKLEDSIQDDIISRTEHKR